MKINFVLVLLCDNDFATYLRNALRDLIDECGGVDFCPVLAHRYIVEHIVSANLRQRILDGTLSPDRKTMELERTGLYGYLSRIRIECTDKLPTEYDGQAIDHDSGSVYYDVNLNDIFPL
jgi:hypothetical protein